MLKNKKVVIIGGSSGIGLESAKQLVAQGAEVIIASRSEEKLRIAKEQLGVRATTFTLDTTQEQQVQSFFEKFGQFDHLSPNGSITLFSGVVAYKSMVGSAMLGAVNAAVSNLGQTLALELAPIRVNIVSPGIIDTPSRSKMPEEARNNFYATVENKLPVKRIGRAEDVAQSVLYLLQNSFVTGTVLHVEGGHILT